MQHAAAEVLDDDLRLLLDVVRVQAHELGKCPRGFLLRQVRIVFGCFEQSIVGLVCRVVRQHVENETLLDRLTHAVEVESFRRAPGASVSKQFDCFPFRGCGEREEAQIRLSPSRGHYLVQAVFPISFAFAILVVCCGTQNRLQLARSFPGLAGMGLVHDHRIAAPGDFRRPRLCSRLLLGACRLLSFGTGNVQQTTQDEGELLQRRNHDLGAVDQGFPELPAVAVNRLDHTLGMLDLINCVL